MFLEDGKVDVDFVTDIGKTGALITTELKNTKVLDILLREYGANPNFRNKRGDALVHVAIRARREDFRYTFEQRRGYHVRGCER